MGKITHIDPSETAFKTEEYYVCDCGSTDFSIKVNQLLDEFVAFECEGCGTRVDFEWLDDED